MNYLDTILSEQELSSELIESIKKFDKIVDMKLEKNDIQFTDKDAEMVFCNHIVALIKRCKAKEFVDDIDESMMEEVSKQAFHIAEDIVGDIFIENNCSINQSEVFLVATHIQMYLDSRKN